MRDEPPKEMAYEELLHKAEAGAAALSPVVRLISQQISEVRATRRLTKVILGIAIVILAVGIASAVGIAFIVIPLLTRN
jgi:hypothetical protein